MFVAFGCGVLFGHCFGVYLSPCVFVAIGSLGVLYLDFVVVCYFVCLWMIMLLIVLCIVPATDLCFWVFSSDLIA